MGLERQPQRVVVIDHMLGQRHVRQRRPSSSGPASRRHPPIQTAAIFLEPAGRATSHKRLAAGRAQSSGKHRPQQAAQAWHAKPAAAASILSMLGKRRACCPAHSLAPARRAATILLCLIPPKPVDLAAAPAAPPDLSAAACSLQRRIPIGKIDIDGAYLDAMLARIAHDLGRRIKAHRLGIENGAQNTAG